MIAENSKLSKNFGLLGRQLNKIYQPEKKITGSSIEHKEL